MDSTTQTNNDDSNKQGSVKKDPVQTNTSPGQNEQNPVKPQIGTPEIKTGSLQTGSGQDVPRTAAAPGIKKNITPLILRFKSSERWLHWGVAVPFMVCWATAFILVIFYNPNPQLPLRSLISLIHKISGISLIVLPILFIIKERHDLRMHFYNIRTAWSWSVNDLKWIALMLPSMISKKFVLPDQDKFNAAEKVNFIAGMLGLPLLIASGIMIWYHVWTWQAWIFHILVAAFMTPIILGHIFMATVNPDTKVGLSGMVSGYVNRQWAKHHYAVWYREYFEKDKTVKGTVPRVYRPESHKLLVDCPLCEVKLTITRTNLIEASLLNRSLECPSCHKSLTAISLVKDTQMLQWIQRERKRRGLDYNTLPRQSA